MSDNARFHNKLHRKNHHSAPTIGYPDSATDPIASAAEPFQGDFYISGNLNVAGALNTTFNTLSNISIPTPVLSATIGFNPTNSLIVQLAGVKYAIPVTYVGNGQAPTIISNSLSGITTFSNGVSVIGSISGVDSINWNNVYTIVNVNSASWLGGNTAYTNLTSNSGNWQSAYTTVTTNSALWTTGVYVPIVYTLSNTTSAITPAIGSNTALGLYSNIAGGCNNQALSAYSAVLGGCYNVTSGLYSSIAGGQGNIACGNWSNVAGGYLNSSSGNYTIVGGGRSNCAINYAAAVIGGYGNTASGNSASIGGGINNTASGGYSSVVGGSNNKALSAGSNVNGGISNTASGIYSVVGGGKTNIVTGNYSGILGGFNNSLSGSNSFIIGSNISSSANNTVVVNNLSASSVCGVTLYGDGSNVTNVLHASDKLYTNGFYTGSILPILGGNTVSNIYTSVIGGKSNTASGIYSSVAGGSTNTASGSASLVSNGKNNTASGAYSSVIGGKSNTASGYYSSILGGCNNINSQCNSFIIGSNITATLQNYTYINNLSVQCSLYAGLLFGDGTNLTNITYTFGRTCTSNSNNSIIPKFGNNSASGYYSFVGGGSANDTKTFNNVFILGTALSANQANYTYVNNISSQGNAYARAFYGDGSNLVNTPASFTTNFINSTANWNSSYTTTYANSANWSTAYNIASSLYTSINTNQLNVVSVNSVVSGYLPLASLIGNATGSTTTVFHNIYTGVSATTDILIANDLSDSAAGIDIGIASSRYNGNIFNPRYNIFKSNDAYMYSTSANNLTIGTTNGTNNDLIFFTGGALSGTSVNSGNERMRITNTQGPYSGYVGINTSTPNQQLTVNGSISSTNVVAASSLYIASISSTNADVGSITAKMPIYNASGTFIGYIPIYTS
jgi:hypothetical protein